MTWLKAHTLPFTFLASLVFGLLMVSAAAFTVSLFWGLLVLGLALIAGGHWVTYLKTITEGRQR